MALVFVDAIGELSTTTGLATGSIWCTVPPSMLQHYTSTSLSVGQGAPSSAPKVDYVPTAGTMSANVAFSCALSAGGDGFTVAVGSTAKATYVSNFGQVVNDNWTRTS
jgi:hypothetical protein